MLANLKIICRFHAHPVHQNSVDIFVLLNSVVRYKEKDLKPFYLNLVLLNIVANKKKTKKTLHFFITI